MKNPKLVIGIVAIVALLLIFFLVYKNSKRTVVTKSGTTVQQAGFVDTLLGLFQPKGTGTTSGGGKNAWCAIFPKSKSCQPEKYCDCNKPGYAVDGVADVNCNPGRMFYEKDCA